MDLPSVITLLQLVLAILSNPNMAQSPAAQSLALQAVSLATQALQVSQVATTSPISSPLPPPPPPVVNNTTSGIGGPSEIITPTPPAPPPQSCTLNAAPGSGDRQGDYTWTSVNIPTSTQGQLYFQTLINNSVPTWRPFGDPITSSQGQVSVYYTVGNGTNGPWNWKYVPGTCEGTCDQTLHFKLNLGDTSCFFDYHLQ